MRKLFVVPAAVMSLMISSAVFADKYAVVDIQKAASDTSYMKSQMASLEAALKPQQQKHERLTKEIAALQQKAQTDARVMKEADLKKLEQDYATKMNEYNANAAGMQKRAQDTLENINKTLAPKIESATEELRKSGGYNAIFNRGAVVSVDQSIDLTSQVTQKVNATLK